MELALYCPVYGYYERQEDTVGRRGDFFTSVSVGPLFGELLAFQFCEWLEPILTRCLKSEARPTRSTASNAKGEQDAAEQLQLVEAGAHDGRLAVDILGWLRQWRPALFERLEYWIIEPSDRHRECQQSRLREFGRRVRWARELKELWNSWRCPERSRPMLSNRGVIFSNELLDAFPVHRLGWDAAARRWFEWGVQLDSGQFRWTRMPLTEPKLAPVQTDSLAFVLPDGFTIEVCPAAEEWWRSAAAALQDGKLVTLDYGFAAEEKFLPERTQGTLRAFYQHHATADLLARPGEQDLTAHVNFGSLIRAGESAGLTTEQFVTQEKFLMEIAQCVEHASAPEQRWTPERRRQFQTLTRPDQLGRAFRVLVQSRTETAPDVAGERFTAASAARS